ncbi:hypothetical protein [Limibacillus sp. MBR-115]|uniref:RraA family protein n=1 Tax=Limibacillus sp. MBR-115 TaxID=3156465 RepID=UPI003398FDE5
MAEINAQGLNTSLLHDAIERLKGHSVSEALCCRNLRAIAPQKAFVAPAHTLRLSRAIELDGGERERVMAAYDNAPGGTILAIEVVGNLGGGVVGDVVAHRLKKLGVKAAVVDGCIRDVLAIGQFDFPVWAREISMAGMVPSEVEVEIGVPINLDGVMVRPGDLISVDMDGVFVCPAAYAQEATTLAQEFLTSESKTHEGVASGKSIVEAYPSKTKAKLPKA